MTRRFRPSKAGSSFALFLAIVLAGCGGGGGSGLSNKDPGLNDLNTVVAFGDSLTMGNCCSCAPYPARLSPMIGKTVHNTGINGTMARRSVGRTQQVIDQHRPAYMLILYGVNDLIHSGGVPTTLDAVAEMVLICKQNHVVPVLATYPIPLRSHGAFAGGTIGLNEGIRELAKAQRIKCVDLEREFALETGSSTPGGTVTDPALMESDGLHPNEAGTQIMAMAFADLF